MDAANSLDLDGKLTLRLRRVRDAVVPARTGWADRLDAGQFLNAVDSRWTAGDLWAFVALSACSQEFYPVAGWYPTGLHVGIYEAA
jgi:uncharacterized protein YcgI (DUF1989 family)